MSYKGGRRNFDFKLLHSFGKLKFFFEKQKQQKKYMKQCVHFFSGTSNIRVGKKPGFFQKNQKTRFFWFKPGFVGLNQVFFQSHICVFMNENSCVLEQLITNINYYLI